MPMPHMAAKYTSSGRAIRATSSGWEVTASPCRANSSTIVNSSPDNAQGPITGRNRSSYQARPRARSPTRREANPATSGTPRNTSTLSAICPTDTSRLWVSRPSHAGSTVR
ncbi:Uncharacterised protein [Mycobacteroides abscessus]|nr:Uncharacterised protein [Mycobacteroides abscessus]